MLSCDPDSLLRPRIALAGIIYKPQHAFVLIRALFDFVCTSSCVTLVTPVHFQFTAAPPGSLSRTKSSPVNACALAVNARLDQPFDFKSRAIAGRAGIACKHGSDGNFPWRMLLLVVVSVTPLVSCPTSLCDLASGVNSPGRGDRGANCLLMSRYSRARTVLSALVAVSSRPPQNGSASTMLFSELPNAVWHSVTRVEKTLRTRFGAWGSSSPPWSALETSSFDSQRPRREARLVCFAARAQSCLQTHVGASGSASSLPPILQSSPLVEETCAAESRRALRSPRRSRSPLPMASADAGIAQEAERTRTV